jgi:hypothetical protein
MPAAVIETTDVWEIVAASFLLRLASVGRARKLRRWAEQAKAHETQRTLEAEVLVLHHDGINKKVNYCKNEDQAPENRPRRSSDWALSSPNRRPLRRLERKQKFFEPSEGLIAD